LGHSRRGRLISVADKQETINLIIEAQQTGARLEPACELLEIDIRTLQRWRKDVSLEDKRCGPINSPANKLTAIERAHVLEVVNSVQYRDKPPSQIVPQLADDGEYICSEATMYRVLHEQNMVAHRGKTRPKKHTKPDALIANTPNQVWSWDITFLCSNIRGKFYYLYMFMDIYSRKIVGFDVFEEQNAELASHVVSKAYNAENICAGDVTLHSDNGGPMKGSTMLATLQRLGIMPSFSRPSVSDDNPFSESLFKTLKYCPQYPSTPFASLEAARAWVERFVYWYNHIHHHSGITFVTPAARHNNKDAKILAKRAKVYELARQQNPNRWSGKTRNWGQTTSVTLNAKRSQKAA
jgi:putative transposase